MPAIAIAIASGCIGFVLSPEAIADRIVSIALKDGPDRGSVAAQTPKA